MEIETNKEFWLKLKEDYKPEKESEPEYGFCYYSKEFERIWSSLQNQDIINLVNRFLESEKGQRFSDLFWTVNGFLFICRTKKESIHLKIEVRKQFLNWVISTYE